MEDAGASALPCVLRLQFSPFSDYLYCVKTWFPIFLGGVATLPFAYAGPEVPLVRCGRDQPVIWEYTFENPGEDWMKPPFKAEGWKKGPAPFGFGAIEGSRFRTPWPEDSRTIWLRRPFTVQDKTSRIRFESFHSGRQDVYLNGEKIGAAGVGIKEYRITDKGALKAIRVGRNLLAIRATKEKKGFFDFGLLVQVSPIEAARILGPPLIQRQSRGWRMTYNQEPPAGWSDPRFRPSDWERAQTPVADKDEYEPKTKIPWGDLSKSDWVYFRHNFTLKAKPQRLMLDIKGKKNLTVILNGQPVFTEARELMKSYTWRRLESNAIAALRPGLNTLSVKLQKNYNGLYLDLALWADWGKNAGASTGLTTLPPESGEVAGSSSSLRTWTSSDGRKVEARLQAILGDQIRLQMNNGKFFDLPRAKLCQFDREFIRIRELADTAEMREWKRVAGSSIKGKLVARSADGFILQTESGKELQVTADELSSADIRYLRQLLQP